MSWTTLCVPASSANLGPGFDALGLALSIYLECRFRASETLSIRVAGCDAALIPADASNLIWQTALDVARSAGRTLGPVELEIVNNIPLGKGLGSSAAALVAGICIADQALNLEWSRGRILDCAAQLEGHPDNAAASVLGGFTVSSLDESGRVTAVRLEIPENLGIALIVPSFPLPTAESRAVLPETYSRRDVIFNVQRTSLLVAALAAGDLTALAASLEDRLHQPYRAALVPGLQAALDFRMDGLIGCVLSGAGPAVLAFYQPGAEHVCEAVRDIVTGGCDRAQMLYAAVSLCGFTLE